MDVSLPAPNLSGEAASVAAPITAAPITAAPITAASTVDALAVGIGVSPVRTFGFRLWHLNHAYIRRLEAAMAPLGLTHMQFMMLRCADFLARGGEQPTQTRLARFLATDRMMVSKVVRLLDGKGLVVRAVHPDDPRAHHVVLTEAGRRVLEQAVEAAQRAQAAFFGRLSPEQRAGLDTVLDDLLRGEGCPLLSDRHAPIVTTTTKDEA